MKNVRAKIQPNYNFWKELPKPFFVLAPMADVTDPAFREMFAKYGKPDVTWTEMVSADGLCSIGKDKVIERLKYTEAERPIVAQIFGSNPEHFETVAKMVRELGFDGLDINMGCPDKNVEKQGAGSALMKNPKLAQELIRAAMRGGGDMPVSVKTRIGYSKNQIEEWIPMILETHPAALTVHGRTRKEMSDVPAHWNVIADVVAMNEKMKGKNHQTLILGNGDVQSLAEARARVQETGVDGVMIGRGIFGKPWFFNREWENKIVSVPEKLKILVEHTKRFEEIEKDPLAFPVMKKHFKAYVSGFKGSKELRIELMATKTAKEVESIIERYLGTYALAAE